MADLIKDYDIKDIFNCDETGLFFKALPEYSLQYSQRLNNDIKTSKERLTLLLCCNMDGSEKLKPLIIGKSEKPRCFKNVNKAALPCYYRNNASAWMTSHIFANWLGILNKQFEAQKRHVIIFMDNFSGHKIDVYSNITIAFLPPNCSSVIQPLDQGIIEAVKRRYRTVIVREKIERLENNKHTEEINIKTAMYMLKRAWDAVIIILL